MQAEARGIMRIHLPGLVFVKVQSRRHMNTARAGSSRRFLQPPGHQRRLPEQCLRQLQRRQLLASVEGLLGRLSSLKFLYYIQLQCVMVVFLGTWRESKQYHECAHAQAHTHIYIEIYRDIDIYRYR